MMEVGDTWGGMRFRMWEVKGVGVRICWGIKWSGRYKGVMKG